LGLAVNAYLMALTDDEKPTSSAARARCKAKVPEENFRFALDFKGDLEKAFNLWDAVFAGVKEATDDMIGGPEERKIWQEVDDFVQLHR
jgi:hypothetical protein